jgi:hypothetical protein
MNDRRRQRRLEKELPVEWTAGERRAAKRTMTKRLANGGLNGKSITVHGPDRPRDAVCLQVRRTFPVQKSIVDRAKKCN